MKNKIIAFLEAFLVVWDELANSPSYTENFPEMLKLQLNAFCRANGLPAGVSADELLSDIKSNRLVLRFRLTDESGSVLETGTEEDIIDKLNTIYHYDQADNEEPPFTDLAVVKPLVERDGFSLTAIEPITIK